MGTSLAGAIRKLTDIDPEQPFGSQALDAVDVTVPFDHGTFNVVDPPAKRCEFVIKPDGPKPAWTWETYARYLPENPYYQYVGRTGDATAHRISEFLTDRELERLALYREVFLPARIRYQVAFGLPARRPVVVGFGLSRERHDFTDGECEALNTLRPHVIQAYRSSQRIAAYRRSLADVSDALGRDGRAVLLIDGEHVERYGAAEELLACYYPGASPGRLAAPVAAWVEDERAAWHTEDPARVRQPLVSRRQGRRLVLRFAGGGGDRPDVVFLDERTELGDEDALRDLGLTTREAQVMGGLVLGDDSHQIASRLGISEHTVRTHVEKIYRKLGVSTRAAATALILDALHSDRGIG